MGALIGPLNPSHIKTGIDYSGHHDAYVSTSAFSPGAISTRTCHKLAGNATSYSSGDSCNFMSCIFEFQRGQ